jgi:hypothetical protein
VGFPRWIQALAFGLLITFPAVLVSFAVLPLNGDDYHPPKCFDSPQRSYETLCIHYLPLEGRYEFPPPGIPADIARLDPSLDPPPTAWDVVQTRYGEFTVVFSLAALVALGLRARRELGTPAEEGSGRA